jgi:Holliday junction DNA helicase RuvA
MIATLEGTLDRRGIDSAIIKVGGIGFDVHIPSLILDKLGPAGGNVLVYIHLHLKDDGVTLYGFSSQEELGLFRDLISVSGVGPRAALSLLSSLDTQQLVAAITSENTAFISQVPGIGKKIASRIVVDLKSKLEKGWQETSLPLSQEDNDALAALTSLGYSVREASRALTSLSCQAELSLEEKVKLAIRQLSEG